jgi:hypothetical protein
MNSSGGNATTSSTCGKQLPAQFQLVAAFDAAPVPPSESGEEIAPETTTTETTSESSTETSSSETTSTEEASGSEGEAE